MPIRGWSDALRVPRLGTIALGRRDERGVPYAVDHFVVPPEVEAVYGPEPRELDILIPGEDLEKVFPAWLKRYGDQFGLICRGDGETATLSAVYARKFGDEYGISATPGIGGWRYAFAGGEPVPVEPGGDGAGWLRIPCPYRECPHYRARKCTEVAMLSVLLPKVPGVLGVYQLDTGSFNSYQNVLNSLEILRRMVGRISFIPLKLKVRMETHHPVVLHEGEEKRVRSQNPVLYVDMGDLTLERVLELAREGRLLKVAALPAAAPLEIEPPDEDEKPELLYPPQEAPDISAVVEDPSPGAGSPPEREEPESPAASQPAVSSEVSPEPRDRKAPEPPASEAGAPAEAALLPWEDLVFRAVGSPREVKDKRGRSAAVRAELVSGGLPPGQYTVYGAIGKPAVDFLLGLAPGDEFVVSADAVQKVKEKNVLVDRASLAQADALEDLGEDLDAEEALF